MDEVVLRNLGIVVIVSTSIVFVCVAILSVGHWLTTVFSKFIEKVEYRGAKNFGARLIQDSYWFSEDVPTMRLIRKIGEEPVLGFGRNISQIRDAWREDRIAQVIEKQKRDTDAT